MPALRELGIQADRIQEGALRNDRRIQVLRDESLHFLLKETRVCLGFRAEAGERHGVFLVARPQRQRIVLEPDEIGGDGLPVGALPGFCEKRERGGEKSCDGHFHDFLSMAERIISFRGEYPAMECGARRDSRQMSVLCKARYIHHRG